MPHISNPISGITTLADGRPSLRALTGIDWGLLLATLLLAGIGLATVHSASIEMAIDYFPRQTVWVLLGLLVLVAVLSIDYHVLLELAAPLYLLGLVLLVLVHLVGIEAGGARSWLGVGPWRFQPSEFAKLATALALSRYFATVNRPSLSLREISVGGMMAALPAGLVALEPDLGGAALFLPILAGALLVAGIPVRTLLGGAAVFALVATLVWSFGMEEYQRQRVAQFLAPNQDPLGTGYQLRQSKIAVGSGELWGKGYMQGTQSQLRFLPARHTDFIFAVLAEEWGFLGVATVLGLYALSIVNGARIAMRARDRAGILLVVCLLSLLSFHVLYNTAMVVGLVPITGIPLPFLSYGGSFTLLTFTATGLILGVDLRRYVNR